MTNPNHACTLRRGLFLSGLLGLWTILAAELVLSVRQQSQTWNEAYHLMSGYRYWQAGDFGMNAEHPPLVKLLSSLPLLHQQLKMPQVPEGTSKSEGVVASRKFLFANDADALLLRARLSTSFLTLLLALLVFEVTYRMFGAGPALLALGLVVFEPNLLAHGALVTTDMGMTCIFFAAVYAFYRYVKHPSVWTLLACGFVAGLCLAVKHSGILVIPTLGFLAFIEVLLARRPGRQPGSQKANKSERLRRHMLRMAAALLMIIVVAVIVLWAFYGFRFQARPDNLKMTPLLAEYMRGVNNPGLKNPLQSHIILWLERWRLLPESYLYGFADVLIVSAGPRPCFLFGKLYPRGRWYYFPSAFAIKSTLGFLALLLLSSAARRFYRMENLREILFLTIPPGFYFAVSLTSGLNVGVRHLLPVYPFLLVLAAAGAWALVRQNRRWAYVVAALSALHVFSSARSFPDYLAYSNEVWGGPKKTYRVLTDSNADWGQGLVAAKKYLDRHRIKDCWLAYFGSADPEHYQIPCKLLPDAFDPWWKKPANVVPPTLDGTLLIGATQMASVYWGPGELSPYQQFLRIRPADNIGGAILVFKGQFNLTVASEWSRLYYAWELFANRQLDRAIAEARGVVARAPRMVPAHYTLGFMLAEARQRDEARREYETALSLARTIHPEYQWFWVPFLQRQLDRL